HLLCSDPLRPEGQSGNGLFIDLRYNRQGLNQGGLRQRSSATSGRPENAAIWSSESPVSFSRARVCSPSVDTRLPAPTFAPDIRNGRFITRNVPPPSCTSASALRWASCGSASACATVR